MCDSSTCGSGVCSKQNQCGFSQANDYLILVEDSYRLRVVYDNTSQHNLDKCSDIQKQQFASKSIQIDILCESNSTKTSKEAYIKSETDDRIYIEMSAKQACPRTLFTNEDSKLHECLYYPSYVGDFDNAYTDLNNIVDLSDTESFYHGQATPMSSFDAHDKARFEFQFNLCGVQSGLSDMCDKNASVCMIDHLSYDLKAISLGRFVPGSKYHYVGEKYSSKIKLVYENGSDCATSSRTTYSSQIDMICSKETKAPSYVYKDEQACRYYFEWRTHMACLNGTADVDSNHDKEELSLKECKIYSKLHNYTFDLSGLFKLNDYYHIKTGKKTFK